MNSTLKDQLFFTTHKFGNWWWWWEKFTFVRLKPFMGDSLVPQLAKYPPQWRRLQFNSWVGKFPWRRDRLPTLVFLGFPGGSEGKESTCNLGDPGSIKGVGWPPGEGNSYPLQYSCLEDSRDRGVWWAIVHGFAESQTRLSDQAQHSTYHSSNLDLLQNFELGHLSATYNTMTQHITRS